MLMVMYMKETGRMTKLMGMEFILTQTGLIMWEIGKKTNKTETE